MLALLSITVGTLWQKRHGAGVDLRTGAAIQFIAAAVVLAPFALLEGGSVRWSGQFVFALASLVVVLSRAPSSCCSRSSARRATHPEPVLPGAADHGDHRVAAVR